MVRHAIVLLLAVLVGCAPAKIPDLHLAAMTGDAATVEAELRRGEDPSRHDNTGVPPLAYAMGGKHFGIAQMLIDAGADVNAEVEPGVTIVDALDRSQDTEAADWLVARGAHRKP